MASRRPFASVSPLVVTAAWVAAALGAGCLQQAPAPMSTAAPTSAGASIAPVQAGIKPTAQPAADSTPDPLTSPSVDSDLPPADSAALESLVDSDELQAYLPSDLIHDGGVILYRTLAEPETGSGKATTKGAEDKEVKTEKPEGAENAEPPSDWKRSDAKREKGRALELRKEGGGAPTINSDDRRVKVTVKYAVSGSLQYTGDAGRAVRKSYRQLFDRSFKFQFKKDRWELAQVSALHHESQGGHSGLDITRLAIFAAGNPTPLDTVEPGVEKFAPVDEVATIHPGDSVRVEVAAKKSDATGVFVYAYLVGATDRSRALLVDDGTAGDAVAGDGLYTGTFIVPQVSGLHHFAVDVLDPTSFSPGGLYRSVGLGTSVKVQAK